MKEKGADNQGRIARLFSKLPFTSSSEGINKVLLLGTMFILLSFLALGGHLFIKSRTTPESMEKITETNKESAVSSRSNRKIYTNQDFGYSINYSSTLIPREIESEAYLDFVIFFAAQGTEGSGFAVSVRENQLEEEIGLIKKEIGRDVGAELVYEGKIDHYGYSAHRLDYEPETKGEGEPRTIIIINNGKYSYSISSTPEQIDNVLSGFGLVE